MAFSPSWKLQEHRDLIKAGFEHNLILELLSKGYRRKLYDLWNQTPLLVAKSMGCKFSSRTPVKSLREVYIEEIYNVRGFIPKKGDTVVDVGANFGDSTIWWAKVYGAKVKAFEPLDKVYDVLKENVELNHADVELFHMALGDGSLLRGFSEENMLTSSGETGDLQFTSQRLDDIMVEKPDLLKIDVEGFEYEVLSGAKETISSTRPPIIIETHSLRLREKCDKFLSEIGYKLEFEGRKLFPDIPGMDVVQNLFYSHEKFQ